MSRPAIMAACGGGGKAWGEVGVARSVPVGFDAEGDVLPAVADGNHPAPICRDGSGAFGADGNQWFPFVISVYQKAYM